MSVIVWLNIAIIVIVLLKWFYDIGKFAYIYEQIEWIEDRLRPKRKTKNNPPMPCPMNRFF